MSSAYVAPVGERLVLPSRTRESGRLGGEYALCSSTMTSETDIAILARQISELTKSAAETASQLQALRDRADVQQQHANVQQQHAEGQQERIDLAARQLIEVSRLLQAAADALRESI